MSRNRSIDVACWPKVFDRRMPLTLSVSSVAADRSARVFWVSVLTARRTLPTRKVRYMKNGVSRGRAASAASRGCIATMVLTATATLLVMLAAVSVTTAWIPPTSFASRLWISPVRVSVKNRSGMRWRWA